MVFRLLAIAIECYLCCNRVKKEKGVETVKEICAEVVFLQMGTDRESRKPVQRLVDYSEIREVEYQWFIANDGSPFLRLFVRGEVRGRVLIKEFVESVDRKGIAWAYKTPTSVEEVPESAVSEYWENYLREWREGR